jgi:IS605 OrfB family transposase
MLSESLVKVKKTIKAKVLELRRARRGFLNGNARTFNAAFTGTNLFHSATRQQAERLFKRGNSSPTKNTQRSPEETFIVNEALENGSMIVLGKLKGIRSNGKGRRFNIKLNNGFPYHRLSQFIEYKAKWLGIKVVKVSERNTSRTCHRCGHMGLRAGSLKCPKCGYTCNADHNGAMLKRLWLHAHSRGCLDTALNSVG